jgi:histidyl-tRNA synthetase
VKDFSLQINSLGDKESKNRYRDALVKFLTPKSSQLSEDSQRRLTENPLRILDSKDPRDQSAVIGAPPALESLSDKSRQHFQNVQAMLRDRSIAFTVNPNLVRGFDYYTGTVWEVTTSGLGAQNAIGGGGRYDNLVEILGGRPTPGVGFGIGLERLLIALDAQQVTLPDPRRPLVWLAALGPAARQAAWNLLADLRAAGVVADMDLADRSMKAQFKIADREAAKFCLILGDNELARGEVMLKDLSTGDQSPVPRTEIISRVKSVS